MTSSRRRIASILICIANVGYIAWGGMAAFLPDRLSGPGGKPILSAGFEGFTGMSFADLENTSPAVAQYTEVLFRMYGMYCLLFGLLTVAIAVTAFRRGERWAWWTLLVANVVAYVSAMIYDRTVNAIGPFEMTEYLGLALILIALTLTWRTRAELITHLEPG